jgi:hypothetical protein
MNRRKKIIQEVLAPTERWRGPAWLCPKNHQMHPDRMKICIRNGFTDAPCLGGCGWIDMDQYSFDKETGPRTEGRKTREEILGEDNAREQSI